MSRPDQRDQGMAMVTVLLVAVVLMGLTATLAVVTQRGTAAARSDASGAAALGQGEAGIAQAVQFLRSPLAVAAVNACATGGTCTTDYGRSTGAQVTTDAASGQSYVVQIAPVSASTVLAPPLRRTGQYRITSTGTSTAEGVRRVEVIVQMSLHTFPFGIYTAQDLSQPSGLLGSGISVFTGGCVNKRSQLVLSGATDLYYGGPPAAHAAGWITDSTNGCSGTDSKNIHRSSTCNTAFPHDQDRAGAVVSDSSGCAPFRAQQPAGSCAFTGSRTSAFSEGDLTCYNPNPKGLPTSTYEELKRLAQLQGTYFTTAAYSWPPPNLAQHQQGVVYFDVPAGADVSLNSITSYETSQCATGKRSVVVVVRGGNATINGGASLTGAVFVPEGTVKLNGDASLIGTIFSQNIEKGAGSADIRLDPCYVDNLPSSLLDVQTVSYREIDSVTP